MAAYVIEVGYQDTRVIKVGDFKPEVEYNLRGHGGHLEAFEKCWNVLENPQLYEIYETWFG